MKNRDLIRDAMMFAVKDITGRVLREATVQSMIDDFEKQLTIPVVGSSLPKVCKGCGTLSTKKIDKKYLACCPDNNYIPMEDYCKNSIYPEKQF